MALYCPIITLLCYQFPILGFYLLQEAQMTAAEILTIIQGKIAAIPEPILRPEYWRGYEDALRTLKRQIEIRDGH